MIQAQILCSREDGRLRCPKRYDTIFVNDRTGRGLKAGSIKTTEEWKMNDYYTEQMVKKQTDMKDIVIKAVLVAATIVSFLIIMMYPIGLILPIVMIALDVFMFGRLKVEYEYLFVNGDLDIDKIMNKSKRKKQFSMNVADMELLAPADAVELRQYQNARVLDYSSRSGQGKTYALIVSGQGELKKVLFEPNTTIVEGFYMMAPRKVIRS